MDLDPKVIHREREMTFQMGKSGDAFTSDEGKGEKGPMALRGHSGKRRRIYRQAK